MKLRHVIAAAALAAVSAASFAQSQPTPPTVPVDPGVQRGTNTPLIDKHEANQEQRIKDGRQSGELTKHEAHKLKAQQKSVDRAQAKAAADGTVTAEERQAIRKKQDKAGKAIYRQKHDAASAPAGK